MKTLVETSQGEGVQGLIDRYFKIPNVQGFGLGIHWNFISLVRQEYDSILSVNEILEENLIPSEWAEICQEEDLPEDLSPIYIKMYVDLPVKDFLYKYEYKIDNIIYPGHLLIIEEISPFVGLSDRRRHRPIKGGISVGNLGSKNTGTIGGFVQESNSKNHSFLMSCNHVLYALNSLDISQQGPKDGGGLNEKIGSLKYEIPLKKPAGYSWSSPYNKVDIALASISYNIQVDENIRGLGRVKSIVPISQINLGDEIVFVGKESDTKYAYISEFIARKKVHINGIEYLFGDVFKIEPIKPIYVGKLAQPGDSGAWVLTNIINKTYDFYGALFAGSSEKYALCCFSEYIFDELERQTGMRFSLY